MAGGKDTPAGCSAPEPCRLLKPFGMTTADHTAEGWQKVGACASNALCVFTLRPSSRALNLCPCRTGDLMGARPPLGHAGAPPIPTIAAGFSESESEFDIRRGFIELRVTRVAMSMVKIWLEKARNTNVNSKYRESFRTHKRAGKRQLVCCEPKGVEHRFLACVTSLPTPIPLDGPERVSAPDLPPVRVAVRSA